MLEESRSSGGSRRGAEIIGEEFESFNSDRAVYKHVRRVGLQTRSGTRTDILKDEPGLGLYVL